MSVPSVVRDLALSVQPYNDAYQVAAGSGYEIYAPCLRLGEDYVVPVFGRDAAHEFIVYTTTGAAPVACWAAAADLPSPVAPRQAA